MKTIHHLQKMKQAGEKITVLTAYDASFARLLSQAGVDVLLVGDSLGSVIGGHNHTIAVTLEEIEYHTRCVAKGNQGAMIIADLPFMTYSNKEQAIASASRLMRAGASMIKIEGGSWLCEIIQELTIRGIPVCGHVGLTAQYVHALGGYKVQGRDDEKAQIIMTDAQNLQKAGASLLVIECVPEQLARRITDSLHIPTIGIGASRDCDGQVLVVYDVLGLSNQAHLTFVKNFLVDHNSGIEGAIKAYIHEVKNGLFPALEHCFT